MALAEDLFWTKFRTELQDLVNGFRGVASAVVIDLEGNRHAGVNGELQLAAGSTIKVPVLMRLFRAAAEGVVDLEAPYTLKAEDRVAGSGVLQHLEGDVTLSLRNLAILMINLSDNIATNVCINAAGMAEVNDLLAGLGCVATLLRRLMIDWQGAVEGRENLTSAADMARWLQVLYNGELVDRRVSDQVLAVLRKSKRTPIRAGVPDNIPVAGKTGGLEGVRNEVAVVEQVRRPYIVSVMSAFSLDGNNDEFITSVSSLAYGYMSRLERFTDHGRGLPAWCFEKASRGG